MSRALLIDIGNSRIKWCCAAIDRAWPAVAAVDAIAHAESSVLDERFAPLEFDTVWVSNVAGEAAFAAVAGAVAAVALARGRSIPVQAFHAAPSWGPIRNGYQQPESLGADRWAAMIGAAMAYPAQSLVIVSLGTATTIDWLDALGHYRGGVILPGVQLMRQSLARATAQLPLAEGGFHALATNTDDGIESGIVHAQAGAIERVVRVAVQHDASTRCLLTGGSRLGIAPVLPFQVGMEDNLVLRGVWEYARAQSPTMVIP